jgi:hypothetical protein
MELRVRNRLLEYLDDVVSYQSSPEPPDINELLNQWEDWVPQPISQQPFLTPPYSQREAEKLKAVNAAWNRLCEATPTNIVSGKLVQSQPEWLAFSTAASVALSELNLRGPLPEAHL